MYLIYSTMFSLINKKSETNKNDSNMANMISNAIKTSTEQQKSTCPTCPNSANPTTPSTNKITCNLGNDAPNTCTVNKTATSTCVTNCPDNTKYEIKVKNKPGPTGPTGPPGPQGPPSTVSLSSKLQKFEKYLYEVPDTDEVYTIGLQSQVNPIHAVLSQPTNTYSIDYLKSNVVWLFTANNPGPYFLHIHNVPDIITNDNKLIIYMPTHSTNQFTNYVDTCIVNYKNYTIYWENGILPDLTYNTLPSVVRQECNILPHFNQGLYTVSSRTSFYTSVSNSIVYYVKILYNAINYPIYALSTSAFGPYEKQKSIQLLPGKTYIFDMSDPINTSISSKMVFGTVPDNVNTIKPFTSYSGVPGQVDSKVVVKIPRLYSDGPLYYFDELTENMGYENIQLDQISAVAKILNNYPIGTQEIKIDIDVTQFMIGSKFIFDNTVEEFIVKRYDAINNTIFLGNGYDASGNIIDAFTQYNHYTNETVTGRRRVDQTYIVTVSGGSFYIDASYVTNFLSFDANKSYLFLQDDTTNVGNTIIFGGQPDVQSTLINPYIVVHGDAGSTGAYTMITYPQDISYIAYFSAENKYYGYGEPEIDVSSTNVFTTQSFYIDFINRTGSPMSYTISGSYGPTILKTINPNGSIVNADMSGTIVSQYKRIDYIINSQISTPGSIIISIDNTTISTTLSVQNPFSLSASTNLMYNRNTVVFTAINNLPHDVSYAIVYNNLLASEFVPSITSGNVNQTSTFTLSLDSLLSTSISGDITFILDNTLQENVVVYKDRQAVTLNKYLIYNTETLNASIINNLSTFSNYTITYSSDICANDFSVPLSSSIIPPFTTLNFSTVPQLLTGISGDITFAIGTAHDTVIVYDNVPPFVPKNDFSLNLVTFTNTNVDFSLNFTIPQVDVSYAFDFSLNPVPTNWSVPISGSTVNQSFSLSQTPIPSYDFQFTIGNIPNIKTFLFDVSNLTVTDLSNIVVPLPPTIPNTLTTNRTYAYNGYPIQISAVNNQYVPTQYEISYNSIFVPTDFNTYITGGIVNAQDTFDISLIPQLPVNVSGDFTFIFGALQNTFTVYNTIPLINDFYIINTFPTQYNTTYDYANFILFNVAYTYPATDVSYVFDFSLNPVPANFSIPASGTIKYGEFTLSKNGANTITSTTSSLTSEISFDISSTPAYDFTLTVGNPSNTKTWYFDVSAYKII